ncbi:MAG: hypothetical protein OXD54_11230 [Candidatus Poribacteria bacterium]|nr:hypothetical protein [Candidatus Poribacteria bacterium]
MRKNYQSNVNMLILLLSIMIILQQIGMSHAQEESNHKEETETESKSTTTDDVYELDKILVEGERAYSTASSKMIRDFDLNVRPASTAQDMLQLVPGLVIAQHAGGGKAEQIFFTRF